MKKEMIFEILNKIESDIKFKRKLRAFLIVGIIGFFIISAMTVWLGFKAVNYVASKSNEVEQTLIVQGHVVSCWSKVQSLIAIQVWFEKSAIDNLMDLKVACLENISSSSQNLNIPKNQNNN